MTELFLFPSLKITVIVLAERISLAIIRVVGKIVVIACRSIAIIRIWIVIIRAWTGAIKEWWRSWIAVIFIIAGHMYRTNFGIGHSMKEILEAHKGPFTGAGHKGLYEVLTTSWHAQLAINLALFGSLSIIVAYVKWVTLNFAICWNSPISRSLEGKLES